MAHICVLTCLFAKRWSGTRLCCNEDAHGFARPARTSCCALGDAADYKIQPHADRPAVSESVRRGGSIYIVGKSIRSEFVLDLYGGSIIRNSHIAAISGI